MSDPDHPFVFAGGFLTPSTLGPGELDVRTTQDGAGFQVFAVSQNLVSQSWSLLGNGATRDEALAHARDAVATLARRVDALIEQRKAAVPAGADADDE